MEKHILRILVVLLIAILSITSYRSNPPDLEEYNQKIEQLKEKNLELDTVIRELEIQLDSLSVQVAGVDSSIILVENWYEKKLIDIIDQPIAADVEFFTNYLSEIDFGILDSYNSDSIKAD